MSIEQYNDPRFHFTVIISNELQFKKQLAIGEDAYKSLKIKNKLFDAWDTAGAAGTAATIAGSSSVASTFFGTFWTSIGIGTAATPVGWVIAASAIGGAAWFGFSRFMNSTTASKVMVIPTYINTPIDLLATNLFDMLAFISLKVASIDGHIDNSERNVIYKYFVEEWGYSSEFVRENLRFIEEKLDQHSLAEQTAIFADYQEKNPDCNSTEMTRQFIEFLNSVVEADGVIDEREEMAIDRINQIFKEQTSVQKRLRGVFSGFKNILENGVLPK